MHRQLILCMALLCALCLSISTVFATKLADSRVALAGHNFKVEIATTDSDRERGLMHRTHLAADHGMLFVYPDAQVRNFWMKNTLISLDILFFDSQRRLINISADTPPCKTDPCPTFSSTAPAQYVLELKAGTTACLGIKTGETFTLQ